MGRKKISGLVRNPTDWQCGYCGKTLKRRDALLRHMGTVHRAPFTLVDASRHIGYPANDRGQRLE